MAEVLNIDEQVKVKLPDAVAGGKDAVGAATTAIPERCRFKKRKAFSSVVDNSLPLAQDFFKRVGVDILICVWEFLHQGNLEGILPLMLSSKCVYSRMEKERDLVQQIAKSTFTFFYLSKTKGIRRMKDLIALSRLQSGAEFAYNQYVKQQFLRNGRLLKKHYYRIQMKVWPRKLFIGHETSVLKVHVRQRQCERLHCLLTEFEEAHNAIAMKIFLPQHNHYPLALYDSTLYLSGPTDRFEGLGEDGKVFYDVRLRIRFTVHNLRYRFSLVAEAFDACA